MLRLAASCVAVPAATCLAAVISVCAAACGGSSPSPAPPSGGTDAGERVTGSERLGWSQSAPSSNELDQYRYAAYVDGQRLELPKALCGAMSGGISDCSAALPPMSIGRHTLELVAVFNGAESAHSQPIVVTMGTAVQPARVMGQAGNTESTLNSRPGRAAPVGRGARACFEFSDACYDVERVALQATEPHALAAFPDGRIVVAEADTRILSVAAAIASDLQVAPPCGPPSHSRINAISPDPAFAETRLVYLAWSCDDGAAYPRRVLVIRYRDVDHTLGEAATVFHRETVGKGDALLAVTRDQRLTIAIPGPDHWDVVRLTTDGRTPPEHGTASPVVLQRRSVTALSTGGAGERVFAATDDGFVDSLPAQQRVADVSEPVVALGVDPQGESLFVVAEGERGTLRRLMLSSTPGSGASFRAGGGVSFGDDVTGVVAATDGSLAVLTRSHTVSGGASAVLFHLRLPSRD